SGKQGATRVRNSRSGGRSTARAFASVSITPSPGRAGAPTSRFRDGAWRCSWTAASGMAAPSTGHGPRRTPNGGAPKSLRTKRATTTRTGGSAREDGLSSASGRMSRRMTWPHGSPPCLDGPRPEHSRERPADEPGYRHRLYNEEEDEVSVYET